MELDASACHSGGAAGTGGGMSTPAAHTLIANVPEYLAAWLAFVSSPAAPKHAMSALELDGYLTGVLASPSLIPPSRWMAGLWGEDEPVFDGAAQMQSVLGAVTGLYTRAQRTYPAKPAASGSRESLRLPPSVPAGCGTPTTRCRYHMGPRVLEGDVAGSGGLGRIDQGPADPGSGGAIRRVHGPPQRRRVRTGARYRRTA